MTYPEAALPATSERLQKLHVMLEKEPNDAFLLYAIALEHKKLGNTSDALVFFQKTLDRDPGYCVAYHQRGLTYEEAGDEEAAKIAYREGIAKATQKGDRHAASEMQAALSMID